jgi:hypothetical protein
MCRNPPDSTENLEPFGQVISLYFKAHDIPAGAAELRANLENFNQQATSCN